MVVARYHLQSPPEVSLVFSVLLLLGVNFSPQIRNFKQKEKSDISRAYADKMLSKLEIKRETLELEIGFQMEKCVGITGLDSSPYICAAVMWWMVVMVGSGW